MTSTSPTGDEHLPAMAGDIAGSHPDIWAAYAALGKACSAAGPLEAATQRLVKLALAMGADSEGAVHSHVRRALAEGMPPEALRHVALLAIPTLGFPAAMRVLSWVEDITNGEA